LYPEESLIMPVMSKIAKGKVVLHTEVPPEVKTRMERLAKKHRRSTAAEVTVALEAWIERHEMEERFHAHETPRDVDEPSRREGGRR
jgi:predicted DNA-binding protein